MEDPSSVDVILDFLRRNRFTRAEAALRSELYNRPDLNGFLQKLALEDKEPSAVLEEEKRGKSTSEAVSGSPNSGELSKELIVKEIECGTGRNGSESKWRNAASIGERNKPNDMIGTSDKSFTISNRSEDSKLDLCSWNFNPTNGPLNPCQNHAGSVTVQSRFTIGEVPDSGKATAKSVEDMFSSEKRTSWLGSTSKVNTELKYDRVQMSDCKELDQRQTSNAYSEENIADDPWSKSEEPTSSSSDLWKDFPVKTVFPLTKGDASTMYNSAIVSERKEGKKTANMSDVRAVIKEQVDEIGRALFFGKSQMSSEQKNTNSLVFSLASDDTKEEFPKLPPVKLKSEEKSMNVNWEEKFERDGQSAKLISADNTFLIGSYLDVPVGQEISSAGGKRIAGGSWLSVSQGIAEDTSDLVSGFATVGDGLSESVDYPNEYWDSDEYDDDDDVGYMRQPIEDEAWFLAHEIDYPSDNEKGTGHGSVPDTQERAPTKDEDDDQSFAEEDSYFSGEQYFQAKNIQSVTALDDPIGMSVTEMYGRNDGKDLIGQYDGQLMDEEELNLMRAEPVWQGFVTQSNELIMLEDDKVLNESERVQLEDICMDDDQHGSVRSIGVGFHSDAADFGSEVRESLVGGSSEGDLEYFHDHDGGIGGSRHPHHDSDKIHIDRSKRDKKKVSKHDSNKYVVENNKAAGTQLRNHTDGGFSFPPPLKDGQLVPASSGKSLWSNECNAVTADVADDGLIDLIATDDMLATWRRKSSDSSTSMDENNENAVRSADSTPSSLSNYGYGEREHAKKEEDGKTGDAREEYLGASLEDEEAAAVQEQVRQIKAQEEEFETFNLKIVHRKNRTGFEEDKNFHVVLNCVIAGRYHVTEYLGSAAFSKAIQAHDLHTGMDVCVKIIKNNKDFFDQSLDEIKLLKHVNKHDPGDKYHILRLYDYFYYREHLLIVCELLKANLYEFHKFNRESGGEVYFTMPRLQSITTQCLEALQFLHGLGLIHCDLKPENILVKSYSRCEVLPSTRGHIGTSL
ncbi:Pkinase domain-containing protein [Cephalotus follicularis]|uniref:Pkinase domain-containing protein n=1 Tax=Cephalotus follicularis TaxID=3775 RepID=A0A1Q3C1A9_CEPFO|nr:Pkinase domain-containing protein [Cephalotus follicularis]